jgi:hypothetical protein
MKENLAIIPIYNDSLVVIREKETGKIFIPTQEKRTNWVEKQVEQIAEVYFPKMTLEKEDFSIIKMVEETEGKNKKVAKLSVIIKEFKGEKTTSKDLIGVESIFLNGQNISDYRSNLPWVLKESIKRMNLWKKLSWKLY